MKCTCTSLGIYENPWRSAGCVREGLRLCNEGSGGCIIENCYGSSCEEDCVPYYNTRTWKWDEICTTRPLGCTCKCDEGRCWGKDLSTLGSLEPGLECVKADELFPRLDFGESCHCFEEPQFVSKGFNGPVLDIPQPLTLSIEMRLLFTVTLEFSFAPFPGMPDLSVHVVRPEHWSGALWIVAAVDCVLTLSCWWSDIEDLPPCQHPLSAALPLCELQIFPSFELVAAAILHVPGTGCHPV